MKLWGALLLLASVGCHGSSAESATREPQRASGNEASTQVAQADTACCSRCPLALPGVSLKFAQATAGGSMLFSAPDAELAELRDRVRELAAFHNRENSRLAMLTMPHQAEAVEVDGGAQLLLTTAANNDVSTLQKEIENEVQWMQGGRCPGAGNLECQCQLDVKTPPLSSAPESEAMPPPQ